jgi:8-oxo-dGTP pyrophosphatase MutT (NUDIX family)
VSDVWDRLALLPPVAQPVAMKAAVLAPLYEDVSGEVRVILTVRPKHMNTHAGDVVFPGGMIDRRDGGPVAAATREAWEEVGIPPESVQVLGGLTPVAPGRPSTLIVPVVARVERPSSLVLQPEEVEAVIEPTVTELLEEGRWDERDFHGHTLWFFEFPEATLWGATAFMVRELLGYLR